MMTHSVIAEIEATIVKTTKIRSTSSVQVSRSCAFVCFGGVALVIYFQNLAYFLLVSSTLPTLALRVFMTTRGKKTFIQGYSKVSRNMNSSLWISTVGKIFTFYRLIRGHILIQFIMHTHTHHPLVDKQDCKLCSTLQSQPVHTSR